MRFAEPFAAGWGAVRRSKRLLALASLTTGLAALPYAIWTARQVDAAGARRPDAVEVARSLDPDFFFDVRQATPSFEADAASLVVASLVLAVLLRPLLWGGYAGIAASRKRVRFAKFVREGGASYWKFLRLSLIGVVLLWALSLGLKPLLRTLEEFAAEAPTEDLGRSRRITAQALAFLALCVVPMILDYARIGVRMRRRPGVVAELGRSAAFVLQHPFRTSGFYLAGLVLEIALCAPLLFLLRLADGAYVSTSVVVLVLGQLLVAVREGCRLFHLAGAWRIREAEERSGAAPAAGADGGGADILDEPLPWHAR